VSALLIFVHTSKKIGDFRNKRFVFVGARGVMVSRYYFGASVLHFLVFYTRFVFESVVMHILVEE
jgi:hypothetical protein